MRYILTAEGGRAGRHRIAVGKQGAAGRLITGIEYALGSRYLGERGVAPDLRPARGKGGPGAVLTLPLPVVAALMGESDPIADKPTWRRVDRAIETARTKYQSGPGRIRRRCGCALRPGSSRRRSGRSWPAERDSRR